MNTIFSVSVWCEVHGPVNIFCTQAFDLDGQSHPLEGAAHKPNDGATSTSAASHGAQSSPTPKPKGTTCASCSFTLPPDLADVDKPPILKTVDEAHGQVYLSQRHPTDPERYKILRNSCIRALSGEMVPGRSGPIFFGDPSIGYNIATIFRLRDGQAGGNMKRTFCFMCTSTEEQDLLRAYTFITDRFAALVEKLVASSLAPADGQEPTSPTTSFAMTTSAPGSLTTPSIVAPPHGFLRTKGRAAANGLPVLTGMPDVFVQIHAVFAWLLQCWLLHYTTAHEENDTDTAS